MKRGIMILILLPCLIHAQDICGIFNNSIIIQNGRDIGPVGDVRWVVRETRTGFMSIGQVKIKERFEDMVIATVVYTKAGYQISVGDLIATEEEEMASDLTIIQHVQTNRALNAGAGISPGNVFMERSDPFRRLRFGLSVGTLLPYQTLYQRTNYSYQIGPVMQLGFNPRSAVLFDLMVSVADERSQPNQIAQINNQSVVNLNALYRQGVYHSIFMDVGAGVYVPKVSVTATPEQRKVNSLEYHYGVCAGLAIQCIRSNGLSLFINPRYHTYLMRNELVENVSVGMNFIL
ncbi:hypothetical protein JW948_05750 [bacterium]|nr:hypothetical protein [bacterium]